MTAPIIMYPDCTPLHNYTCYNFASIIFESALQLGYTAVNKKKLFWPLLKGEMPNLFRLDLESLSDIVYYIWYFDKLHEVNKYSIVIVVIFSFIDEGPGQQFNKAWTKCGIALN